MEESYRVGQVFVSGGMPTITYNPRAEKNLEEQVEDYLDEGHKILSVSGPTKTGKTVLVGKVVRNSLQIDGGDISDFEKFLEFVGAELGAVSSTQLSASDETATDAATTVKGGAGSWASIQRKNSEKNATARGETRSMVASLAASVKSELAKTSRPLVIDDFHYINSDVQQEIVRFLKSPVFKGLRVVLISVPHRANDVVRVENEMTGRVAKLDVGFWGPDELRGIATVGFEALNLASSEELVDRLVEESFHSPHLMQNLCRDFCKKNGVRKRPEDKIHLVEPTSGWSDFFQELAAESSKTVFDQLARGKRQRRDRKKRILKGGIETDIYGLVLSALATNSQKSTIKYEELRASVKELLQSDMPQRHEITGVLEKMTRIAKEEISGEPVIEYDSTLREIHVPDPYFAYYLRWGARVAEYF